MGTDKTQHRRSYLLHHDLQPPGARVERVSDRQPVLSYADHLGALVWAADHLFAGAE
jgi:hypothetical protein